MLSLFRSCICIELTQLLHCKQNCKIRRFALLKITFLSVSPSFERSALLRQLAIGQHCDLMCQNSSELNIGIISLKRSVFCSTALFFNWCWWGHCHAGSSVSDGFLAMVGLPEQKRGETQRQGSMGDVCGRHRKEAHAEQCMFKQIFLLYSILR